jgi:hypothetical protein
VADHMLVIPATPGIPFMANVNQHSALAESLLWGAAFRGEPLHNKTEGFTTVPP